MVWQEELKTVAQEALTEKEAAAQKLLNIMLKVEEIVPGFRWDNRDHVLGDDPFIYVPFDGGRFLITRRGIQQRWRTGWDIHLPEEETDEEIDTGLLADSMVTEIDQYLREQLEQYQAAQETIRRFCSKKAGWSELRELS